MEMLYGQDQLRYVIFWFILGEGYLAGEVEGKVTTGKVVQG